MTTLAATNYAVISKQVEIDQAFPEKGCSTDGGEGKWQEDARGKGLR